MAVRGRGLLLARWAASAGIVLAPILGAPCVAVAAEPWRIVILEGRDPAQPSAVAVDREFRRTVQAAAPNGVEFYTDPIDSVRFQGTDLMPEYLALLTKEYSQRAVDLVVVRSDFGLEFAERYHQQLWPDKPVLLHNMEEQRLRQRGVPAEFALLPLHIDIDGTLAIAEALQPTAQRLVVVVGTGAFDQHWAQRTVLAARQRSTRHWLPEVWSGVPVSELRVRLAALDLNTAVFYPVMYRDRDGNSYFPYEVVPPMVEVLRVPIYGWYPTYIDAGATAGSVMSYTAHARRSAELAISLLRGERAAAGATLPVPASSCVANVGRIVALGLDVRALPTGCELVQQPRSVWREYRGELIAALAVLALQALTIAGLLLQRHRRQLAEDEASRRRLELARATRVAALGELSASIAHEVAQPLTAILANTQAAELSRHSDTLDADELREILSDVRRDAQRASQVVQRLPALIEKRQIELAPLVLDNALDEAVSLLVPEARRRGVTIERRFNGAAVPLVGDRIQLQQVLLNLVINAMDAMRDVPPIRCVVTVSTQPMDDGLALEVADRGHGLSSETQERMFESFFTTKPHGVGLGLSIVRTVVRAHGGRVSAAAREGGGSVFTVWLPQAGASA
jgi:signal transduction histidine kinase